MRAQMSVTPVIAHCGGCHCGRVRLDVQARAEIEVLDRDWEKQFPQDHGAYPRS
jgi:hypothetical protein